MDVYQPSSNFGPIHQIGCNLDSYSNKGFAIESDSVDRFIPNRNVMDMELANYKVSNSSNVMKNVSDNIISSPSKDAYKMKLAEKLFSGREGFENSNILDFKPSRLKTNRSNDEFQTSSKPETSKLKTKFRHIPQSADRILDAPDIVDDYYLNLLDWSKKNVVAVALGSAVYLWDAKSSSIEELCQTNNEDEYITSLAWNDDGQYIAVGTSYSDVEIYDSLKLRKVRTLKGHSARVGSLAWNGSTLTSGGRDSLIINHDVRTRFSDTSRFVGHNQEVCGLKWSASGLLASGGNDNLLHIWDRKMNGSTDQNPWLYRIEEHKAAVKALAWCPFQANLLATGGGSADRTIKFWNTSTGVCLNSIDTLSQVCALEWNQHERELLSSHGFSKNQLCLWKYPSMTKIAELNGHTARVLHMAQSPDGSSVVTAAADETLRFWSPFGSASNKPKIQTSSKTKPSMHRMFIR